MKNNNAFQIINLRCNFLMMTKAVITIIFIIFSIPLLTLAQPVNDNFSDAITLEGLSGRITGSNADATKETGEPDHADNSGGKSVWWKWTAPETGYFSFDTHGSSFNTLLAVYTGSGVGNLKKIASNNRDGTWVGNSRLTFPAQSNIPYYIVVDGYGKDFGKIVLNWRKAILPANDDYANAAILAGLSGRATGSNKDATKETGEPDYTDHTGNSSGESVWWKWTAPETGFFSFDTHGSSFDTVLAVYTGSSIDSLNEEASNNNDGRLYAPHSGLRFHAKKWLIYYIVVDGYESVYGDTNYGYERSIFLNWRKLNPMEVLELESVDSTLHVAGDDSKVTLTGKGFDESTRISIYLDAENKKNVIGSCCIRLIDPVNITVIGDTAYVADRKGGLKIIDVSDSKNPEIIGVANTPDHAEDVVVIKDTAYVADGEGGLQVIDVSNPEKPTIMGAEITPGYAKHVDVDVEEGMAYVVWKNWDDYKERYSCGLYVIDINNPAIPLNIGMVDTPGSGEGLAVNDCKAYVADGYDGLQIIDVSDPKNPMIIGYWDEYLFGPAKDVAVIGNEAYMANGSDGLQIIDVSNPKNPMVIGGLNKIGYAEDLAVTGGRAYVIGDSDPGLQIIDVSDSENPTIIENIENLDEIDYTAKDLAVTGNRAYVVSGSDGLQVIDVSIPASPRITGTTYELGYTEAVVVIGDTAYVASSYGLQLIDIRNPANPTVIGFEDIPGSMDVVVVRPKAYVTSKVWNYDLRKYDPGRLYVIDISNPSNPVIEDNMETLLGSATGLAVIKDTAYISDESGSLQAIDVSDPENLTSIDVIPVPGPARDVAVVEHKAYVAWGDRDNDNKEYFGGLCVINVSNPANLSIIESENMDIGYADCLTVTGNTAYVMLRESSGNSTTGRLNVIDLKSLTTIENEEPSGIAQQIVVTGKTAYVADGDGLQIIDVSDPVNPIIIGTVNTQGSAKGVTVIGQTAYVADGSEGLQILDVSNPVNNLKKVWTTNTPGSAEGLEVIGKTAYIADGSEGLQIIDVSNLRSPKIIRSVSVDTPEYTPGYAKDVAVIGKMAYVAYGSGGLQVIDVSNLRSPKIIGSVDTSGSAEAIEVIGNTAYVIVDPPESTGFDFLQAIDVSIPEDPIIIEPAVDTLLYARCLTIKGNRVYVGVIPLGNYFGRGGLYVVDVDDLSKPKIIGCAYMPGEPMGVEVVGNIAYVANRLTSNSLQVIDISNSENPFKVGAIDTKNYAEDVTVIGDTAYVVTSEDLQVIDVSNPQNPIKIGAVDMPGYSSNAIVIKENVVYVADDSGLTIISPDLIKSFYTIKYLDVESESSVILTLPGSKVTGPYTLRVSNQNGNVELPGAVTFVSTNLRDILRTKAIIVAGGNSDPSNKIWQATEKAANDAYEALRYQGYSPDDIYYLSSVSDSDGRIDEDSTYEELEYAIKSWAVDEKATELTLFFVDHGKNEALIINGKELSAEKLYKWLDDLQADISDLKRIILIFDACQSGSFINYVQNNPEMISQNQIERIIITSTAHNEPAYFLDKGVISFSCQFWNSVYRGATLKQAFESARDLMEKYNQHAQIDANGNGIVNEPDDLDLVGKKQLRRGYTPHTYKPWIFNVSESQTLNGETSATLWANVMFDRDGSPMKRVWAVIMPPNFSPESPYIPVTETDIPTVELVDTDNDGIYEGEYDNFSLKGKNSKYSISFYAMNKHGLYSVPRDETNTTITQNINVIIEDVSKPQTLYGDSSAMLGATLNCVASGVDVDRVWAEIIPPAPDNIDPVYLYDYDNDGVFENQYNGFTMQGTYTIKYHATGENGFKFESKTTYVTQTGGDEVSEPDDFEENDTSEQAGIIVVNNKDIPFPENGNWNKSWENSIIQQHNFHDINDEDWVKFYGIKDETYTIETRTSNAISSTCDPVIEIYNIYGCKVEGYNFLNWNCLEDNKDNKDNKDDCYKSLNWPCQEDGVYYVKLKNSDPNIFGENISYKLEVYLSIGTVTGYLSGYVYDAVSGNPIHMAQIETNKSGYALSFPDGWYLMIHRNGENLTVTAKACRYTMKKNESKVNIKDAKVTPVDFYLEPSDDTNCDNLPGPDHPDIFDQEYNSSDDVGTGCFITTSADDSLSLKYSILPILPIMAYIILLFLYFIITASSLSAKTGPSMQDACNLIVQSASFVQPAMPLLLKSREF